MISDKPTSVVLVCYFLWQFFDVYNMCSTEWVRIYPMITENPKMEEIRFSLFKVCVYSTVIVNGDCRSWSLVPELSSKGKLTRMTSSKVFI